MTLCVRNCSWRLLFLLCGCRVWTFDKDVVEFAVAAVGQRSFTRQVQGQSRWVCKTIRWLQVSLCGNDPHVYIVCIMCICCCVLKFFYMKYWWWWWWRRTRRPWRWPWRRRRRTRARTSIPIQYTWCAQPAPSEKWGDIFLVQIFFLLQCFVVSFVSCAIQIYC